MNAAESARCPRCGGPLIRRNPAQLFAVGVLLCASPAVAFFVPLLGIPAVIPFLAGAYLIAWAVVAKGRWCRQCKTFPGGTGAAP